MKTMAELYQMHGINPIPNTTDGLLHALDQGTLKMAPTSYKGIVAYIDARSVYPGSLLVVPSSFAVSKEESDRRIKSLEAMVKIDSEGILKSFTHHSPLKLTKQFLESYQIKPERLIKRALESQMNQDTPPAGVYWRNSFGEMSAFTWTRVIAAAERMMNAPEDAKVIDTTFYADTARVQVKSRSQEGAAYEFTLMRLPLGRAGDKQPYSGWLNMKHNSPDPDTSYRGGAHARFAAPVVFWSTPAIHAVFKAMEFASQQKGKQFRANPFPLPHPELYRFVQKLRTQVVQLRWEEDKPTLHPLNMTEQDALIGHKTMNEPYVRNWFHGKGDVRHLRIPQL